MPPYAIIAFMDGYDHFDADSLALLLRLSRELQNDLPVDKDIMTLPQVAALLHCSEDTLRRVTEDELPFSRVGKTNLYLRDDVLRFVRARRVSREGWRGEIHQPNSGEQGVDQAIQRMIKSSKVDVRKPSKRKVS